MESVQHQTVYEVVVGMDSHPRPHRPFHHHPPLVIPRLSQEFEFEG